MNTYIAGQKARLASCSLDAVTGLPIAGSGFRDINGNALDPTTVSVKYQSPGQAAVTQAYNPGNVVRDGVGLYHYDLDTTGLAGELTYEWLSTGTGQAVAPNTLYVAPQPI